MAEYFLRLLVLVPFVGGLAWASLWLWKRAQTGGVVTKRGERAVQIVDVLTMGTSGKLAVVAFGGRTLLIASSRQGIVLLSGHDGARSDA